MPMKALYTLPFSLFLLTSVAEGKDPTFLSYGHGESTLDVMMPNTEDITEKFLKSVPDSIQKLEYVSNKFKPTQILDKTDLTKANNQINNLGYLRKYCGIVMGAGIAKYRSSYKSPLVQLVMMTDHFSPVKVTLPFRSSSNMGMNKKTLDYYSSKYIGKTICTDKVIVSTIVEGGINYILPHDYELKKNILESDHTDNNYIQIF